MRGWGQVGGVVPGEAGWGEGGQGGGRRGQVSGESGRPGLGWVGRMFGWRGRAGCVGVDGVATGVALPGRNGRGQACVNWKGIEAWSMSVSGNHGSLGTQKDRSTSKTKTGPSLTTDFPGPLTTLLPQLIVLRPVAGCGGSRGSASSASPGASTPGTRRTTRGSTTPTTRASSPWC